ncbi:MAG: hypothetical protein MJ252_02820 [archaeon]|nr:hypothetical protein [archaeon]
MSEGNENLTRFEVEKKQNTQNDDGLLSKIKTMMKEDPKKFYLICGGALAAVILVIVIIVVVASSGGSESKKENPPSVDDKLNFNETLIDELLLTFPKREQMTYEEYLGNLTYYRDKYNLNIENAVFLAYKWVIQNFYYLVSSQTPKKAYEAGHCDCYGYAFLFNAQCEALGFKVGVNVTNVHGTVRVENNCSENVTGMNHMWNSIKIRGKWYLLDNERGDTTGHTLYYFLANPLLIARDHWPDDPKEQHLDTPKTLNEYCSAIFTFKAFGECGFYKIEPDLPYFTTTTGEGNIKIYFTDPNVTLLRTFGSPDFRDITTKYTNLTQYDGYFQIDYKFPSDKRGNYSATIKCIKPPLVSSKSDISSSIYINYLSE